jgi:hypothetical protein
MAASIFAIVMSNRHGGLYFAYTTSSSVHLLCGIKNYYMTAVIKKGKMAGLLLDYRHYLKTGDNP